MKVLVVGSTGPLGRAIIAGASAAGVDVRAVARRPEVLQGTGVEVVRGDVLDPASLRQAMASVDAVVSALGTPLILRGPVTLLSRGTQNVVDAMKHVGAGHLLCITGMGAGDSRGHGGFVYDRIVLPALLGRVYADKDRQEAVVRQSDLDWTLIRPAVLKSDQPRGAWREITNWSGESRMTAIDRGDVATFVVRELAERRYGAQAVNLTW